MLSHFDYYTKMGLKPIPLYPNTKKPIEFRWNTNWEEKHIRNFFATKNVNMGLLLGDIIDVEGDTETANKILIDLIGDYPHPSYSGSKSQHHLFINPDPNLTRITFSDVEFRAHKHQSVIPPSIHPDGTKYVWISDFLPVPEMPRQLLQFLNDLKNQRVKKVIKRNKRIIPKSCVRPWCSKCQKKEVMNRRRYYLEVEAFEILGINWQCRKCRCFDIRNICKKIKSTPK
jgi:hypothetical protein